MHLKETRYLTVAMVSSFMSQVIQHLAGALITASHLSSHDHAYLQLVFC